MHATSVRAVIFDMAGTTVHDGGEVTACFMRAAETNLEVSEDIILERLGWDRGLNPGVPFGTHTDEALSKVPNDGLRSSFQELIPRLEANR
ncbi:MAG: hypothetical protein CMJ18_06020 [Phycisphaeraceae bacterium]|nr:hypothetical protein [Phycisphaeraceae bacterium]